MNYDELNQAGDYETILRPYTLEELLAEFAKRTHGHVVKNKDGVLARCGGQNVCKYCLLEGRAIRALQEAVDFRLATPTHLER